MCSGAVAGLGNDALLKVALLSAPSYCLTPLTASLCSSGCHQGKGNISQEKLEQLVKDLCTIMCGHGRTS